MLWQISSCPRGRVRASSACHGPAGGRAANGRVRWLRTYLVSGAAMVGWHARALLGIVCEVGWADLAGLRARACKPPVGSCKSQPWRCGGAQAGVRDLLNSSRTRRRLRAWISDDEAPTGGARARGEAGGSKPASLETRRALLLQEMIMIAAWSQSGPQRYRGRRFPKCNGTGPSHLTQCSSELLLCNSQGEHWSG